MAFAKRIYKGLLRRAVRFLAAQRLISPLAAARWLHYEALGYFPDLRHPRTLNEKIMRMEFYSDTSSWPLLADKYAVRGFVGKKGLGDILIPLCGVYDDASEINLADLPGAFVLKSNNGSAQALLVYDKSQWSQADLRAIARRWIGSKFGLAGAEPHYLRIKPRIIAEKMLPMPPGKMLSDYKFMCFEGKPAYCLVCSERDPESFHCRLSLFSLPDWKYLEDAVCKEYRGSADIEPPEHLEEMMNFAKILSEGLPFVRVDLYEVENKVCFGEMTLTPAAARMDYFSRDCLMEMGDLVTTGF